MPRLCRGGIGVRAGPNYRRAVSEARSFPCETDIRPTDWRAEQEIRINMGPISQPVVAGGGLPDPLRVRPRDDTRAARAGDRD
jgi:hypothetical protein